MKLLTAAASNAKTAKNSQFDQYLTYILHLAPSTLSGVNTCPAASKGCAAACLNSAGRGAFSTVQTARIRKTLMLVKERQTFVALLEQDLQAVSRKARRLGKQAVVRLNGTSDINWLGIKLASGLTVFEAFPDIQWYDYTKVLSRLKAMKLKPVANYHLTFSRSESNETECLEALRLGFNVAAVFSGDLPAVYLDRPVVSGDSHDLRFLDPSGVVVGLTAKGKAKRDKTGFTILTACASKQGA